MTAFDQDYVSVLDPSFRCIDRVQHELHREELTQPGDVVEDGVASTLVVDGIEL